MPNNNGIAVLQLNFGSRLYFQQSDNKIYELCWDGKDGDQWYRGGDGGDAICTARPDTPIAVTKIDTFNGIIPGDQIIHLYYVGTDDYVKEHVFKDGKWAPGANLESASVPQGTSLAAVGWGLDLPNIRVYYQGYGGTVQELVSTNGNWSKGTSFSGAHMDTPLAAVHSNPNTDTKDFTLHLFFYNTDNTEIIDNVYMWAPSWSRSTVLHSQDLKHGGGLAAILWGSASAYNMRLYFPFNDLVTKGNVVELAYDTPPGAWSHTSAYLKNTFTSSTSPLTARVYKNDKGTNISVFMKDGEKIIKEMYYVSPGWGPVREINW